MRLLNALVPFLALGLVTGAAAAEFEDELIVQMKLIDEEGTTGESVGEIRIREISEGLLFVPDLTDLPEPPPTTRGFHVHENADCGPGEENGETKPGLAAGGHLDPEDTGEHLGPAGEGHLGDLPALIVHDDGTANVPVLAPQLRLNDVKGRSLVIHAGGDNYRDDPEPLGGGGERVACGVVAD